jgi:hypothetical protein
LLVFLDYQLNNELFGIASHPWATPNIKHKANLILSVNIDLVCPIISILGAPRHRQCPITSTPSLDDMFQQNAHACIAVCWDVMTWYCGGEGILQGF